MHNFMKNMGPLLLLAALTGCSTVPAAEHNAHAEAVSEPTAATTPEEATTIPTSATTAATEATEPPTTTTTITTTTTSTTTTTTAAPVTTAEPVSSGAYGLTASERALIESVVMAEAGAEEQLGQMAVAECILNACERNGTRPAETIAQGGYTSARPVPSESVKTAVSEVFDRGVHVFTGEALYFYAPAVCTSAWHESQVFVGEIGGHRFFTTREG